MEASFALRAPPHQGGASRPALGEENRGRMSHRRCNEKGEEEQALLTDAEEEMTKRNCGGGALAFKAGCRARVGGDIKRRRGRHDAA
jgi:hypothetical protein